MRICTLLFAALCASALQPSLAHDHLNVHSQGFPECRKAGLAVVVPPTTNQSAASLLVWGGKGKHHALVFSTAWSLSLGNLQWRGPLQQCNLPEGKHGSCQRPPARWKTFAEYSSSARGVVVWGGSSRPHAAASSNSYFNDLWLLRTAKDPLEGVRWEESMTMGCSAGSAEVPQARRAFGGVLLPAGGTAGKDGSLAISFGRDKA